MSNSGKVKTKLNKYKSEQLWAAITLRLYYNFEQTKSKKLRQKVNFKT